MIKEGRIRKVRKISAVLLAALMLQCNISTVSAAKDNKEYSTNTTENQIINNVKTEPDYRIKSITGTIDDHNNIIYYDSDNNELSIDDLNNSIYNSDNPSVLYSDNYSENTADSYNENDSAGLVTAVNSELPKVYDLRDEGRMTLVKNQGYEGYCWAFASNASIESNILSQPELAKKAGGSDKNKFNLNLSNTGTAWYTMTGISDSNSPYYNDYYYDPNKGSKGGYPYVIARGLNAGYGTYPEELCPYEDILTGYSEELRFYSDYRLKDYSELSTDIDTVKRKIVDNGAVTLSFCCINDCFSADNAAYCDNEYKSRTSVWDGHAVTIAGWDDNYSRDNFTGAVRPENNGAWLCKNSWGDGYGDSGYIWISYESYNLYYSQFIMQDNSAYDNAYQLGYYYGQTSANVPKSADVYTASSDEILTQVSFTTLSSYNYVISVYRLNEGYTSVEDGELLVSTSGICENIGTHYIDVPETQINSGDVFSVVVTGDENSYMVFDGLRNKTHEPGKGYYYEAGVWKDCSDIQDSIGIVRGYPSIMAFTKNRDNTDVRNNLKNIIDTADEYIQQDKWQNGDTLQSTQQNYKNELEKYIAAAKGILQDEAVCAADINNAGYIINYYMSKIDSYIYNINSFDDYYRLADILKSGGDVPVVIELNTDLDFKDRDRIMPLASGRGEFSSIFNGNGHTISNASLSTINSSLGKKTAFFGELRNAVIQDVIFDNIVCDEEYTAFAAIVSERIYSSDIKNVTVKNCTIGMNTAFTEQMTAGIANFAFDSSHISNCRLENNNLYGTTVTELAMVYYQSMLDDNIVSDNHIRAYSCIYSYNNAAHTDNNNIANTAYMISPVYKDDNSLCYNRNVIIEKENGNIRFRTYSDKVESITCNDTSYTKDGDYYYVDDSNAVNSVYIQINMERNTENNNIYKYAVDVNNEDVWITGVEAEADLGTAVEIPDYIEGHYITRIGHRVFEACYTGYDVAELVIPDSIMYICSDSFISLPLLEKITIGDGITHIPDGSFTDKGELKTVILGENVEYIGRNAFFSNYSLISVNIKGNVKYIGENAFYGSDSITDVKYSKDISDWNKIQIEKGNESLISARKEFTHNWSDTYDGYDEHGHWRTCTDNECSEITDYHEHVPGPAADRNNPCVCVECGYIIAPAIKEDTTKPSDERTDENETTGSKDNRPGTEETAGAENKKPDTITIETTVKDNNNYGMEDANNTTTDESETIGVSQSMQCYDDVNTADTHNVTGYIILMMVMFGVMAGAAVVKKNTRLNNSN